MPGILVPYIKEVIRIPKAPVVPLGKKGYRRKRQAPKAKVVEKLVEVPFANKEEEWDAETLTEAVVKDFATGEEVERRKSDSI